MRRALARARALETDPECGVARFFTLHLHCLMVVHSVDSLLCVRESQSKGSHSRTEGEASTGGRSLIQSTSRRITITVWWSRRRCRRAYEKNN